jgi:hypothetical protein
MDHKPASTADQSALITRLSEIAAKAANRAIRNGDRAGNDQNRAQFVEMVKGGLQDVPDYLLGDEARSFLAVYQDGAYGASATSGSPNR